MEDVLVSVFMITYNHENFIRQSLESVMFQKVNFRFEVVIGEDNSTDNTRSIVREYEARYPDIIKPIYHDVNVGGVRNAYEFCFPRLTGKYIACLEGDDYWTDPDKLQKQVDFLENNPGYSFCYHSINAVNDQDEVIETGRSTGKIQLYKPLQVFHLKITTLSVVFRNCLGLSGPEMIKLQVSDYVLFALLSNHGGAADMGFIGGHYRKHEGGVFTRLSLIEQYKYSLSLLRRMWNYSIFSQEQKMEIEKEMLIRKKRYIRRLLARLEFANCMRIISI